MSDVSIEPTDVDPNLEKFDDELDDLIEKWCPKISKVYLRSSLQRKLAILEMSMFSRYNAMIRGCLE